MTSPRFIKSFTKLDYLALVLFLLLLVGYVYNLTGWLIFDDEGEYLYQVWRMTMGEVPYQDFLTPQLPVFLYSGSVVMRLAGPSLVAMRLYSVFLAFGSGVLLFMAGRKLSGPLTGLLAMVLFLVHSDVFKETRIFRNEPQFIFFVTAGLVLATWPNNRTRKRNLGLAGFFFGLATMVKLFGILPAAGIGLWLLWEWRRDKREIRYFLFDAITIAGSLVLTVIAISALFMVITPNFLDLAVGHHLEQGSQLALLDILVDKLGLFAEYFTFYPIAILLALLSSILGIMRNDGRNGWAWQLPTVFAFLLLSRQLGQRHFMYLLPSFSILIAWIIAEGIQGRYRWWGRAVGILALVLICYFSIRPSLDRASWRDQDTAQVLSLIHEYTGPGEAIISDDIGLAYHSQRPTTYSGAALSHGALTSGQITGERLIDEIIQDDVRMVIVDESLLTGDHIVYMRDYPNFHRFLERNFEYQRKVHRDYQELAIWVRTEDRPWKVKDELDILQQEGTKFGESITLLGYNLEEDTVAPGDELKFTLFWQTNEPVTDDWKTFVHLLDPSGELVTQEDKFPYDGLYPTIRWWPGQIIDDQFSIKIPEDAEPGSYEISLGMYMLSEVQSGVAGDRLQLTSPTGELVPNNSLSLLQNVTVKQKN